MGTDALALVTRWEPAVAAFRAAGSMDFLWDADDVPDRLPFATEHRFAGGWGFVVAGGCYDLLRPHLPGPVRAPADAFLRMLYPEDRAASDDLSTDSRVAHDRAVWCAMRPATVRAALRRSAEVPWAELAEIGDRVIPAEMVGDRYVPDHEAFELALDQQRAWLREAAETDCGLLVVLSS